MKILPVFLLLLLLQVWALESSEETSSSDPEMPPAVERYKKFIWQHIDPSMTATSCDLVIKKREIYYSNGCKRINSFILADEKQVKAICQGQGNYDERSKLTSSKAKFRIVACNLKKRVRKPSCHYTGRLLTHRGVVVKCDGGLPVHYDHDF
nr:ribonuclease-like [Nothobranchius furzeri]